MATEQRATSSFRLRQAVTKLTVGRIRTRVHKACVETATRNSMTVFALPAARAPVATASI
jgi:hypothetical protein